VASVGVACEVLVACGVGLAAPSLALALPAGTWEQGWRRRRWRWRLPADRATCGRVSRGDPVHVVGTA